MPWNPKTARSLAMQLCAMLLRRPDDVENEVLLLASSVLFNPDVFADPESFREFLKRSLEWDDDHVDKLMVGMG